MALIFFKQITYCALNKQYEYASFIPIAGTSANTIILSSKILTYKY